MTDVELSYDIPFDPPPRQPKPAECEAPTVASYTVEVLERPLFGGGTFRDVWLLCMRSCNHGPYNRAWRIPWPLPEIGERAMSCLGHEPVTARSGRADPSKPPLGKGTRWARFNKPKDPKDRVA